MCREAKEPSTKTKADPEKWFAVFTAPNWHRIKEIIIRHTHKIVIIKHRKIIALDISGTTFQLCSANGGWIPRMCWMLEHLWKCGLLSFPRENWSLKCRGWTRHAKGDRPWEKESLEITPWWQPWLLLLLETVRKGRCSQEKRDGLQTRILSSRKNQNLLGKILFQIIRVCSQKFS